MNAIERINVALILACGARSEAEAERVLKWLAHDEVAQTPPEIIDQVQKAIYTVRAFDELNYLFGEQKCGVK